MIKREAYNFCLKLNHQEIDQFISYPGCVCFVWNKVLALNQFRLEYQHHILRYQELDFWAKLWK